MGQQQDTAGKAAASDFKSLVLSEDHWKGLEAIVALSSPIYTLLRHCDGNAPVLSKVYMRMLKLDGYLADGDCTLGLPDYVKRYVHELAIARWHYFHHHSMTSSAMVDPEYFDREWSHERSGDKSEPSEWEDFRKTITVVARTPGAAQAGHTTAAIVRE